MEGIGKTMRERNAMTYWENCKEVVTDVSDIRNWGDWSAIADAVKELVSLAMFLFLLLIFPITVPLAGYIRMKAVRKRFQQEIDRQERVKRMQSRVQKAG